MVKEETGQETWRSTFAKTNKQEQSAGVKWGALFRKRPEDLSAKCIVHVIIIGIVDHERVYL